MRRLVKSFSDAISGILYCLRTQKNMAIHLVAAFMVLVLAFYLSVSRIELVFLLLVIFIVLICEVINTSIERAVDLVTREVSPLAQLAKDIAAGAVLLSAILAIVTGVLIFWSYIF